MTLFYFSFKRAALFAGILVFVLTIQDVRALHDAEPDDLWSFREQLDNAMRLRFAIKFTDALEIYEGFEDYFDFTVADFQSYSFSLARRAIMYRDSNMHDKMRRDIDHAIFLAEKHHPYKYTVNTRIYYFKAMTFMSHNNDSAIYYYDKAIEAGHNINFEELGAAASLEWMQLSDAYLYRAELLMKSVLDYEAAFESLRFSLMAASRIEDTLRAFNQRIFIDYHISEFYHLTGDLHTALHYINRVIEMCNQLPDPGRYHWLRNYYYAKAMIHNKIGEQDEALYWFTFCKEMFIKKHPNDRHYFLQLHIGNIWHEKQAYDKADSCYDAALDEYRIYRADSVTPGTRLFFQMYYQRKLENACKSGVKDRAMKMKNHLLNDFNHVNAAKCQVAAGNYQSVARYFRQIENYDSALYYYQKALIALHIDFVDMHIMANPVSDKSLNAIMEAEVLKEKGEILRFISTDTEYTNAAIQTLLLSEALSFDHMKLRYSERSKTDLMTEIYDIYELIFEALLSKNDVLEMDDLHLIEKLLYRSKSVVLKDYLKKTAYQNLLSLSDSLLLRQVSIYKEINRLNGKLSLERSKENPNEQLISNITDNIVTLRKEDELLQLAMKVHGRDEPDLINHDLDQSLKKKPLKGEVNLHYYWGNNHIYVFIDTHKRAKFMRLGSSEKISSEITNYLASLSDLENMYYRKYYHDFVQSSHAVYNSIIAPVLLSAGIDNYENPVLSIIPDGMLFYLPFESLIYELPVGQEVQYNQLAYLIHKFEIHFSVSGRGDFKMSDLKIRKKAPSLLAFFSSGGPEDGGSNFLSHARHELEVLQSHFPRGSIFNDDRTNKEFFNQFAGDYDIIHFSSHGYGDILNGHLSYLAFSRDDANDDQRLYAFEVVPMDLNARLAVLNACETGKGELLIGEGTMSMARGFLYAGIPSVVTSLMEVHDRTGAAIISDFYENIKQGKKLNTALRNSKLNYLAQSDELTAHPVTWSNFILLGHTDALFEPSYLHVNAGVKNILIFLIFMMAFIYYKIVIKN